jgi:cell division protein FtsI (penicillin-binding protein 3)
MRWWPFGSKKKTLPVWGGPSHSGSSLPFQRKPSPLQQRKIKVQHTYAYKTPAMVARGGATTGSLMGRLAGSARLDDGGDTRAFQLRAAIAVFALTLLFGGMMARLVWVAFSPPAEPRASLREIPTEPGRRGNIYDRNGILVAATLKVYSLYADPKRILDATETKRKLRAVLPELSPEFLSRALDNRERRFVWLKRRLTPDQAAVINSLGLPGIAFREEYVRLYPHRNLASHLLGAVDVDSNGLAGVERSYNKQLAKGDDVHLGLDLRMQEILRDSVHSMLIKSESKAAWGVVLGAQTAEIMALTSLPDYDPNHFGKYPDEARFNRAALASYEMGSTFKIFTLAQGLIDGVITPSSTIDARFPIKIGRFTIKDYHAKKAILTATEILRYSSNIGAAKIAALSGPSKQKDFLSKLGFLAPLETGLPERGPVRYPSTWGKVQNYTIAYGHGIMVTPLHMVAAVAALATDGFYRMPHVLKNGHPAQTLRAVYPTHNTLTLISQVRQLMRDVVTDGSGRSSQVLGYDIGGKTGTAEKISGRGYAKDKNVVSFIAAVPLEKPEFVVLVMFDEPKKGFETGGRSSAPAVGEFLRRWMMVSNAPPDAQKVAAARAVWLRKNAKTKPAQPAPDPIATQENTRIEGATPDEILGPEPEDR